MVLPVPESPTTINLRVSSGAPPAAPPVAGVVVAPAPMPSARALFSGVAGVAGVAGVTGAARAEVAGVGSVAGLQERW